MSPMSLLIESLKNPSFYDHPVDRIDVMETHISWIVLTGRFAYKIKKPLDLGFLDFRSRSDRRFFCEEELRINRRLAPDLYHSLTKITGTPEEPILNGPGEPFEYAVKMAQFPQESRLDHVLERGELSVAIIDELSKVLADFHARCQVADLKSPFGGPEVIYQPVGECFEQIRALIADPGECDRLDQLDSWCQKEHARLRDTLILRKREGFIRECHGDAHLANMVLWDQHPVLFDGIEFSEKLRWIDVMSEIAFVVMDLKDRDVPALASRFLNRYLEISGDYAGLELLTFYEVYRALVRAKVAAIREHQGGLREEERLELHKEFLGYFEMAERLSEKEMPVLMMTHGLTGAGKTTVTNRLCEYCDAIRVRTDVERKRHFGLRPEEPSPEDLKETMYSSEMTDLIYQRLADLADKGLKAGFSVIVDGTFIKREHRALLRAVASRRCRLFVILDFPVEESELRQRIGKRKKDDASEADVSVLEKQIEAHEPLDESEFPYVLTIPAEGLSEEKFLENLERLKKISK